MKIRDRINFGFLTLGALVLLTGFAGQYAIDDNADRLETIANELAPELRELGEVEGEIHRIISETVSIALLLNLDSRRNSSGEFPDGFDEFAEEIDEESAELEEAWRVLEERVQRPEGGRALPLEPAEMQSLVGELGRLHATSTELVRVVRSGNAGAGETSVAELKERLEDLEGSLETLLRQAAERQSAVLAEQRTAARRFAYMAVVINLIVASLVLAFVAYFGIFLSRKITQPLSRMQAATRTSGDRENDFLDLSELPPSGADEIAQLGDALRAMNVRLRESTVSRDYVNAILQSMSDMLFVLDESGRIITVNPALCATLGKNEEELIGLSFFDASFASEAEEAEEITEAEPAANAEKTQARGRPISEALLTDPQLLQGGITRRIYLRSAAGERVPAAFAAAGLRVGRTRGLVCVARDIRDDLRREAELTDARERAEAASRAKSEFLMNLSHEIRTPLHSVVGLAALLEETVLDSEQQEHVRSLSAASDALLHLINNFLDLSRVEAGRVAPHPVVMHPRGFLESLCGIYRPLAASKGLELNASVADPVPGRVLVDTDLLNQILGNLIGNAIKFTAEGSISVSLETESRTAADAPLTLVFAIEDTGVGVPENKRDLIFEAFEQADNSITRNYGGTGLGLAISRRLVAILGGKIALVSRPGAVGARFVVSIPVEAMSELAAKHESAAGESHSAHSAPLPEIGAVRILLVEDNENNQMLVRAFLKRTPASLEIVGDGKAALELLEPLFALDESDAVRSDRRLPYDLILMDMQMPVMDGYSATRALRKREKRAGFARVPIVALTAHALDDARAQSIACGCDEHVVKPIGKRALLDMIARFATVSRPE